VRKREREREREGDRERARVNPALTDWLTVSHVGLGWRASVYRV